WGEPLRGEGAEEAISADAARVAALARAGRHPHGQAAQLEVVVRHVLLPLLARPLAEGRTVGDVLRSPRALAALLYLELHHGTPALDADLDEAKLFEQLGAGLRGADLQNLNRIATTPELDGR